MPDEPLNLPPEVPFADEVALGDLDPDTPIEAGDGTLDRMRGTGVGTEDPNIVGEVGPTDIPPGRDPESLIAGTDEVLDDGPVVHGNAPGVDVDDQR